MILQHTFLLAAALQATPAQQQQMAALPPSPVARLVITPTQRTVTAGDTVRLRVQAVDAAGQPVPNVRIVFRKIGAYFEGEVDSTGLVTAGSPGVMPVGILALVDGVRPVAERIELRMVPGPATRIELSPRITKLAPGQRIRLGRRASPRPVTNGVTRSRGAARRRRSSA